jgi:homocysteine S-methyltransferase
VPPEILARMARWTSADDQLKEGIAIAQEIIARVRPSVRGLQLSAPMGQVELLDSLLAEGAGR